MALVVGIKPCRAGTLVLQAGHGSDKIDVTRETGCGQLVPDKWAPAGDFGDRVAEKHCCDCQQL